MCFIKNYDGARDCIDYKHKTSEHDIQCYKVLRVENGHLLSVSFQFPYEIGKTYEKEDYDLSLVDGLYVLNGQVFHSYSDKSYAIKDRRTLLMQSEYVVVSCVIPAGTPFWHNSRWNEYASMKIKIVDYVFR